MPILVMLLGVYVLVALFVMFVQRRLIYFPARTSPELAVHLAKQEGFQPWRNSSGNIIGWHLPAKSPATGAVLVVHGNAGCAFNRGYLAKPIHAAAAVDVFLLEYPGYGCRAGSPSQRTILAAAEEAFTTLADRIPVYIVSESLGAGVAAHLAQKHSGRVAGLALFVPYDKLSSVAQSQMPFLPAGLLLWDQFNPAESLKGFHGPIKVVIAGRDTIIPPALGRKLYESYGGPKSLEEIPNAGHNDVAEQTSEWWQKVFSFWQTERVEK